MGHCMNGLRIQSPCCQDSIPDLSHSKDWAFPFYPSDSLQLTLFGIETTIKGGDLFLLSFVR